MYSTNFELSSARPLKRIAPEKARKKLTKLNPSKSPGHDLAPSLFERTC